MVTHFTAKERAFVNALKADTGRDLDAWMIAIRASGYTVRNDVIDWLRQQGFTFAHASWLERIHHNGGKLIYAETMAKVQPAPTPEIERAARHRAPSEGAGSQIETLLAAAKAYRPLAQMILTELLVATPGAEARARAGHIAVGSKRTFAALLPTPKDARLMLALGPAPVAGWERPTLSGPPLEAFRDLTHMKVLSDARQIDAEFKQLIRLSIRNCPS